MTFHWLVFTGYGINSKNGSVGVFAKFVGLDLHLSDLLFTIVS